MAAPLSIETVPNRRFALWGMIAFVCARLASLLAMPLDGLRGYGDFIHFFNLASLHGWPFLDYWSEFPPLFSFLSAFLYRLSGGQEHVYDYLLFFILTLADAGSLYFFMRLAGRIYSERAFWLRAGAYVLILLSLAYGWWYFDSLAVFFLLLAVDLLTRQKSAAGGAALAAGILTKWFPGLALVVTWRRLPRNRWLALALTSFLPVVLVWGILWAASPSFTRASVLSQGSKGSWETVWALLDGNLNTGNFGPEVERYDPFSASRLVANPPVFSPWLRLVVFAAAGLTLALRLKPRNDRQSLALLGLTFCLFFLWSPGWSPQWVLYLLPLILLVLVDRQALLFALMFVLVNLLEWPVLLSRGMFAILPLTVLLRSLLLVLLAYVFYKEAL